MTAKRIAEIEKMLLGYEAWRERWFGVSGFRISMPPAEVALRELLAELKQLQADHEALRLAGNYFVSYVAGPLPGIESSPDNLFPKRANGTR